MNTIALNIYNRTRHSSIVDFNYLWTEPQTPTRLKWTTYQACLGLFYSWSFLATIFIFIFCNWTTYLAWLRLIYSWNFLATRLFFLSEKIDWQVWTSCLLVRNGWLTCLLARKGWLTWLASWTGLIKFPSKMPNLMHFKQVRNFFRRTTIKQDSWKERQLRTIKNQSYTYN